MRNLILLEPVELLYLNENVKQRIYKGRALAGNNCQVLSTSFLEKKCSESALKRWAKDEQNCLPKSSNRPAKRKQWSDESMLQAIEAVKSGMKSSCQGTWSSPNEFERLSSRKS